MCYHKLSTLAGVACLVSSIFCLIAVSTPDWVLVAADASNSNDKAEYGKCAMANGDENPNRDTCSKCTRSRVCGWNNQLGFCKRQTGRKGAEECANDWWTCERPLCAGMKSFKYGLFYYCENQVVGEEVISDFCAKIWDPGALCTVFEEEYQTWLAKNQGIQTEEEEEGGGGMGDEEEAQLVGHSLYCDGMTGNEKDNCIVNMGMCGPSGIAAQFFGSFMSGLTFFAQFLGYSVGNNWMPHPYMKQRPKIWKIRLKILVYTGAGMAGIGALCGLALLSIWSGIQGSMMVAATSGYKCEPGVTCPVKGFSYYLIGVAVFINCGIAGAFIIQPRFFGKKFNLCAKIRAKLFGAKTKRRKKKKGGLSDMYANGGGGGEDEDEDDEDEDDEDEEDEGGGEGDMGNARFRV